jgi:hypothetical protein
MPRAPRLRETLVILLNALFAEQANIITLPIQNMAASGGAVTPWVSLKNYHRATLILIADATAAAEAPTITLQQATAVAGTGAKNLTAITRVHRKTVAAATGLETLGTWTLATQTAAATFVGVAEQELLYAIDVYADDLDVAGGFDCVRATIADIGTTNANCALFWILWGARYAPPLSPLAN